MDYTAQSMVTVEHTQKALVIQLPHRFLVLCSLKLLEEAAPGFHISLQPAVIKIAFLVTGITGSLLKLLQHNERHATPGKAVVHGKHPASQANLRTCGGTHSSARRVVEPRRDRPRQRHANTPA